MYHHQEEKKECEEEERFPRKYWEHLERRFNNIFINTTRKSIV